MIQKWEKAINHALKYRIEVRNNIENYRRKITSNRKLNKKKFNRNGKKVCKRGY